MWIFILFDLPTQTKQDVKAATDFRTRLIKSGYIMHQYSIYIRSCTSRESAETHAQRLRRFLPKYGKVTVMKITDRQFQMMTTFYGKKEVNKPEPPRQLTLF